MTRSPLHSAVVTLLAVVTTLAGTAILVAWAARRVEAVVAVRYRDGYADGYVDGVADRRPEPERTLRAVP